MDVFDFSAPTVYDCNFERDTCKWQQSVDNIINWTRTQGPYGSQSAGPISDHTLGTGWLQNVQLWTHCEIKILA